MDIHVAFPGPAPAESRKDLLAKLFYANPAIAGIDPDPDLAGATFRFAPGVDQEPPDLRDKVRRIFTSVVDNLTPLSCKVYFDRQDVTPPWRGDVYATLLERGEIVPRGKGLFSFGPIFCSLMHALDGIFVNLGRSLEAEEYAFPTLLPVEVLGRCQYFASFPNYLTLAHHLPEDIDVLQDFSARYRDTPPAEVSVAEARSENALSPAVCYHVYHTIEGAKLAPGQEGRTFLCKGKCFRYESGSLHMVERLWDFTMREVVFVGSQDFVLARRAACLEWAKDLLDALGLRCRIESASDPFFAGEDMKKQLFQKALELKYEILVELPHSGYRLAVGSLNFHQNFFGKTFSIADPAGMPACTGCTAFGVERFALAFLAQHGPDPDAWPARIRERL